MSALLQHGVLRAKIDEKSHVFEDEEFECILKGFGEGFGSPKTSIFIFFRCFFEAFFKQRFGRAKIAKKVPNMRPLTTFWDGPAECAASGERKREGS